MELFKKKAERYTSLSAMVRVAVEQLDSRASKKKQHNNRVAGLSSFKCGGKAEVEAQTMQLLPRTFIRDGDIGRNSGFANREYEVGTNRSHDDFDDERRLKR